MRLLTRPDVIRRPRDLRRPRVLRRHLAVLALVVAAVGSCELPKPPVPQLPGGHVDDVQQLTAGGSHGAGLDSPGRPIAAIMVAAAH